MATFKESKMTFNFPDSDFYHIEKSPLHGLVDCFKVCECIVKFRDKVTLIEAKSSTPNPKNKEDFDEFIFDIMSKFRDTMAFYNAVVLRHDEEPVGTELKNIGLKTADYQMILIVHGHKEEWLPPVMDALKSEIRHLLIVWKIKDTSVKVINETIAKDWNIITDFEK